MRIGDNIDLIEKVMIEYEWNRYRGFLDTTQPYLAELTTDWYQDIEERAQQIEDEDQRADFYIDHSDDAEDFHQFNVILASSFFASSYFFFEHRLMRLCQRSQRIHACPFSVKDIKARTNLDRVKKYMKGLGINFPTDAPEWCKVKRYNAVRNAIAHNGGLVPPNWRKCELEFAGESGVLAGSCRNRRLELTRSFCDDALDTFQRFLIKVLESDPRLAVTTPAPIREIPATGTDSHNA